MVASRVFLGLMVVEWKVRFTSIKPPNITRPLELPSSADSEKQPETARAQPEVDRAVPKSARPATGAGQSGRSLSEANPLTMASLRPE